MESKSAVALASAVAILLVAAFFIGAQVGGPSQSTTTTSSTTTLTTSGGGGYPNGLQLKLSVHGSTTAGASPSVTFQIRVEEYNSLATSNNVTKAGNWQLSSLSLGACGTEIYPFGVALYRGVFTADNASTANPLRIYPVVPCPLLIRYVTGYLFQPASDLAVVLPGGPNATAVEMAVSVNASAEYSSGLASTSNPLGPGTYTIAAGDEEGAVEFAHLTVGAGSTTSSTAITTTSTTTTSTTSTTSSLGTLLANFTIGPTAPVCMVNSTVGPAPPAYASIKAVITPQSGPALTIPITWLSNGCAVSGSLQTSLAPGTYSLNLSTCQFMGCARVLPKNLTIVSGQTTSVLVAIDTGIR